MNVQTFLQTLPTCAQDVYHAYVQVGQTGVPCDEVMFRACSELKGDPRPALAAATLASDGDVEASKKWLRAKLWVNDTGEPMDFPTSDDPEEILLHCSNKQQEITVPIRLTPDITTVGDLRRVLRDKLTQCGYYRGGHLKMYFSIRLLLDTVTLDEVRIRPGCVIIFSVV